MSIGLARTLALALALGCVGACSDPASPNCRDLGALELSGRVTIGEGLVGVVRFWEGNFMPGTSPCPGGQIRQVSRTIHVYELTHRSQATLDPDRSPPSGGPFYTGFATRRVATTRSNERGFFQVALPAGRYTLVVVEDGDLYANRWDSEGNIFPVQVNAGTISLVVFDITYRASS